MTELIVIVINSGRISMKKRTIAIFMAARTLMSAVSGCKEEEQKTETDIMYEARPVALKQKPNLKILRRQDASFSTRMKTVTSGRSKTLFRAIFHISRIKAMYFIPTQTQQNR